MPPLLLLCYEAVFPVTLYNQDADLQSKSFVLALKLVESADFELGDKERQIVKILFSNQLEKPESWQYRQESRYDSAVR